MLNTHCPKKCPNLLNALVCSSPRTKSTYLNLWYLPLRTSLLFNKLVALHVVQIHPCSYESNPELLKNLFNSVVDLRICQCLIISNFLGSDLMSSADISYPKYTIFSLNIEHFLGLSFKPESLILFRIKSSDLQ